MIPVTIRGGAKLKKFEEMLANSDKLLNKAVRKATEISAIQVEGKVKRSARIPVKTGTLRRSITHKVKGRRVNTIKGLVGTNVPYAAIHEFGGVINRTSAFGRPTKPFTQHFRERRYLRGALEDSGKVIERVFVDEIDKVLTAALK